MKRLALSCLVVILSTVAAHAQTPAPAAGRGASAPRIVSPDVLPDRRVTFRLLAPKATDVTLTGEFLPASADASVPPSIVHMTKGSDGVWTTTVGPVEPETYHYHFTVDGVRTLDPGNPDLKTGSTPTTIMNVLVVRGDAPPFYDGRAVPHGEIRTHWYESKSLGTLRRVSVYVPPGHDRNTTERYPVLYLFHGANADETAWTRFGRVNLILDNLLADKKSLPFIVVMPFGYGVPPMATGVQGQNTVKFSEDLRQDVIPFIEGRYRVHADRDRRAIAGLSMGGGQALSIGLNHLELFSYVGGFSAALGGATDFSKTYASLIANANASNQKLRLLWVGCGTSDTLFNASKSFSSFLTEHHITHVFRATDGAHTWMVWRQYLNELAPMLFRPSRS